MTYPSQTNNSWSKLSILTEQLSYRGAEFLDYLGIDYYDCGRYLAGPCPVHGGDNRTAFNFFIEGDIKCNWVCYTHKCHNGNNSVFALVRHIKKCSYKDAIEIVCGFLGVKYEDINENEETYLLTKRTAQHKVLYADRKVNKSGITRELLRKTLSFPPQYYLDRHYSKEVLDKYDIGFCNNKDKPMYNRCVVPIYDDNYEYIIGVTGRSIFDKHECGFHHNSFLPCPKTPSEQIECSKWRNQAGFYKEAYLYNYWFAKYHISESQVIVIVEGPGDVWRLVEAGIENCVAVFGSDITEQQMLILEQSGSMIIVPLSDNDEAGQIFKKKIKERCGRLFRIIDINYNGKDIGELNVDYIKQHIKPKIDNSRWR